MLHLTRPLVLVLALALSACGRTDRPHASATSSPEPSHGAVATGARPTVTVPVATSPAVTAPTVGASGAPGAEAPEKKGAYETVYYKSGSLKIEAYLYRPTGTGPFPVVVYNHGSREDNERKEVPFQYVGRMLVSHGYVAFVPERRGYGKSDGDPYTEAKKAGAKLVPRMQEEAKDVLAGLDYLKTLPFVDVKRAGMMGWSFGGIVTVLALSQSHDFRAGVDQAGGALSWKGSAELRAAMTEAAAKIEVPLLAMAAENDATTESVKTVDSAMAAHHRVHKLIIYPPFTPAQPSDKVPAGHLIFGADGMKSWEADVIAWLDKHVAGK